jgi:hypothetical protein
MKIENEFVPYEQALALKELGFDEPCLGRWLIITEWEAPTGEIRLQLGVEAECYDKNQCTAPLYQQAFRWFREKYKIFSSIMTEYSYGGTISAYHINGLHQSDISKGDFYTYEEAELACLIKLIKLVKNK